MKSWDDDGDLSCIWGWRNLKDQSPIRESLHSWFPELLLPLPFPDNSFSLKQTGIILNTLFPWIKWDQRVSVSFPGVPCSACPLNPDPVMDPRGMWRCLRTKGSAQALVFHPEEKMENTLEPP